MKTVSSGHDREAAPMGSQQYGCPKKTCVKAATPLADGEERNVTGPTPR